ncbi:hypothetical protein ACIBQ1_51090 [Nonomuraea sp. NPDC050153]|uniref:hypothetical protein n=1 Tax=Nonomuraea sp. NPDC050153 TaxID=3364359 RepID=UPI003792B3B5
MVEAVGETAGAAGRGGRFARAVTEVFAPQYVGIAMPPVAGLLAEGWAGLAWGVLAAAVCAGVPATVIAVGVRRGRLDSIHLVERKSRKGPMLIGLATVVVGLIALALLDAPRAVVASVAVMLAWVLVMGPVTLLWKISFHTGVSAGTTVVLAHVLPAVPVLVVGAVVVAVIGWARVQVSHHTIAQALAGAVAGTAAAWGTLALLL